MKNTTPLHFYSRNQRNQVAYYRPDTTLLPRSVIESDADVLREHDRMVELTTAGNEHARNAKASRDLAAGSAAKYRAQVKEALATGKDLSKIKNEEPRHLAEADAHEAFATAARAEAEAQGHKLGRVLAERSASFFAPADVTLDSAKADVEQCVTDLRGAWATWAQAWHVRSLLSSTHHLGGMIAGYTPNPQLPTEVLAAIATIENHLGNHDRLRADETELIRWREEQDEAAGALRRSMGA